MRKITLITALLLISGIIVNAQKIQEINSADAYKMMLKNKSIVILDVRTPGEFAIGHLKGAVNIDVHQPDAFSRINNLDKNATYLVYCRTRNRSGAAVNSMVQTNFKNVYQITDGIVGWNMNKLPLEK